MVSISVEFYLGLTYRKKGDGGGEVVGAGVAQGQRQDRLLQHQRHPAVERKFAGAAGDPTFADTGRAGRLGGVLRGLRLTNRPERNHGSDSLGVPLDRAPAGVSGGPSLAPPVGRSVAAAARRRGRSLGSSPTSSSPGAAVPNWAARMHPDRVSFAVEVEGEASVPATIVSPPPDPDLWDAAFGSETPVATYQFDDYADRPLVTFPVRRILDYVRNRYVAIATRSPSELPTHEKLARGISEGDEGFGELLDAISQPSTHGGFTPPDEATLSRNLAAAIATVRDRARERRAAHAGVAIGPGDGEALVVGANGSGAPEAFDQARLFHYRPAAVEPVSLPASESAARETFEETVDFHQMLSALGDYPALLRRLGLVFDLELPVGDLPLTNGGPPRRLRSSPPGRRANRPLTPANSAHGRCMSTRMVLRRC